MYPLVHARSPHARSPPTPPHSDGDSENQELSSTPELHSGPLPGTELLTPPASARSSIDLSTTSSHCDNQNILDCVEFFIQGQLTESLLIPPRPLSTTISFFSASEQKLDDIDQETFRKLNLGETYRIKFVQPLSYITY